MQAEVDKYQEESSEDGSPEDASLAGGHIWDLILSVLCIAGGIAVLFYSLTLPSHPGGSIGPGLFPAILGALVAIFGMWVGAFALFRLVRTESSDDPNVKTELVGSSREEPVGKTVQAVRWLDVTVALSAIAFYLIFAEQLGFIVSFAIIHIGLMIKFGHKVFWSIIIGCASTIILYWVFDRLLLIQLPDGILG